MLIHPNFQFTILFTPFANTQQIQLTATTFYPQSLRIIIFFRKLAIARDYQMMSESDSARINHSTIILSFCKQTLNYQTMNDSDSPLINHFTIISSFRKQTLNYQMLNSFDQSFHNNHKFLQTYTKRSEKTVSPSSDCFESFLSKSPSNSSFDQPAKLSSELFDFIQPELRRSTPPPLTLLHLTTTTTRLKLRRSSSGTIENGYLRLHRANLS